MSLKHSKLKRALYQTPQAPGIEIERYVIENMSDLNAFIKVINTPTIVINNWTDCIEKGHIIIATDPNWIGYPTYCFESKDVSHPANYVRIKNL